MSQFFFCEAEDIDREKVLVENNDKLFAKVRATQTSPLCENEAKGIKLFCKSKPSLLKNPMNALFARMNGKLDKKTKGISVLDVSEL